MWNIKFVNETRGPVPSHESIGRHIASGIRGEFDVPVP